MRVVGLPIVCVVLLAAIAIKAGTAASRPPDIAPLPDQTTARSDTRQDTLTKADKLEIPWVRGVVRAVEPDTQLAQAMPRPSLPPSPVAAKIASRQGRDPNSTKVTTGARDRPIKSSPSRNVPEAKKSRNVEPSKPMVDLRPCPRPEGFAGLLRALNLSPGCDT